MPVVAGVLLKLARPDGHDGLWAEYDDAAGVPLLEESEGTECLSGAHFHRE